MGRILVVTGSRTLDDRHPDPKLKEMIALVHCVVAGDAAGPDWWAGDYAKACGKRFDMWCWRGKSNGTVIRRFPDGTETREVGTPYRSPLDRNSAMVRWCAQMKEQGHIVAGVGLLDSRSQTGGTKQTLGEMSSHGILHEVWHY